jgi:hypothetical protein
MYFQVQAGRCEPCWCMRVQCCGGTGAGQAPACSHLGGCSRFFHPGNSKQPQIFFESWSVHHFPDLYYIIRRGAPASLLKKAVLRICNIFGRGSIPLTFKVNKKSQNSRNQGFSYVFGLLVDRRIRSRIRTSYGSGSATLKKSNFAITKRTAILASRR